MTDTAVTARVIATPLAEVPVPRAQVSRLPREAARSAAARASATCSVKSRASSCCATTDHATWPGCGTCGPCRQAAPGLFTGLRELRGLLDHARLVSPSDRQTIYVVDVERALGLTADGPPPIKLGQNEVAP